MDSRHGPRAWKAPKTQLPNCGPNQKLQRAHEPTCSSSAQRTPLHFNSNGEGWGGLVPPLVAKATI
eukprot:3622903-Alexandrium_andersonii.AAC.1